MHSTTELSTRLGVNAATIRRWSDEYQQHMSADSHTGDARQYTDDDLLVLWSVRRWRQLGYSLDDIRSRLADGQRASEPLPSAPTSDEVPRALMIPESVHTVALAEIKRLEADRDRLQIERDLAIEKRDEAASTLNGRINALEREIGELRGKLGVIESERRPASWWLRWLAIAVVAAVLVTAAVAVLLALAGR
jgi:DNA-binding transcriptional MerR regulator